MGLAYGSIGDDVGDLVGDSETTQEVFLQGATDLVEGFYATALLMLALIACGFAISSALRPRGEEEAGRVESLLATALRRRDWLLGHVAVTVLRRRGGARGGGPGPRPRLRAGHRRRRRGACATVLPLLSYVAPVLVLSGVARLLVGVNPRLGVLAWLPLGLAFVVMFFGDLLELPQWLQDLSPFEHLALVPAEDFALGAVPGPRARWPRR